MGHFLHGRSVEETAAIVASVQARHPDTISQAWPCSCDECQQRRSETIVGMIQLQASGFTLVSEEYAEKL